MKIKSTVMFFTAGYLSLALLAYLLQIQLIFSSDVAYLIHTAFIQLAGGKYGAEIFETNPPMILYLYYPVCFLMKWTGMNMMLSLRLYILFLALVSSGLCAYLLNKIFQPTEQFYFKFLLIILWIIFLFVPVFEIGQREHLFVLLMFPYLFTAALKLENKTIPALLALFIGLLAGLGFALKPFFLIPLCFIELYIIYKQRNIFASLRLETLTLCGVLLLYLVAIVIAQPGYLHTIVPLLHYYFMTVSEPWDFLLSRPLIIYCFVVLLSYGLFYRHDQHHSLNMVIWLAALGMTIAFLITRTSWYYHLLPALSLMYLLTASYLGQLLSVWQHKKFNVKFICIFLTLCSVIYSVPLYNTITSANHIMHDDWNVANNQVIHFINSHPGKHSVYCFTTSGTVDCFPLVNLTHSDFGGRFPFFWWYGVFHQNTARLQASKDQRFLINAVADDLNHYQPNWVIVNNKIQQQKILNAMITNLNFQHAWQSYHFRAQIGRYQIYVRKAASTTHPGQS